MLKRILLIIFLFIGLAAFAGENYLNSVVIENNDNGTFIILRTDSVAKLKKKIETKDKIVLTVKGVTQSPDINTLYKNTADIDGVTIQNDGNNELKLYIQAPDISSANIVFDTPNASPVLLTQGVKTKKVAWSVISFILLLFAMNSAKYTSQKSKMKDINIINKEREKALYKSFQKEVASMPDINYKLKSYKKHVLKGETLRNYERKSMLLK